MKFRPLLHIALLIAAMQMVSAFKFRCYWFCGEQTAIQTDYVEVRDECQRYAELRLDTDTADADLSGEKSRKAKLLSFFSSCMADKGWIVPDGSKPPAQAAAPAPAPVAAPAPVPAATIPAPAITTAASASASADQQREKNYLARQSECAFARHSAEYSTIAATRAKACDLECAQHLKAVPGGKHPAACPPNTKEP